MNWDLIKEEKIETPKNVLDFLNELFMLYDKYNLSISHEDGHGAFIIEKNCDFNKEWISEAHLDLKENDF